MLIPDVVGYPLGEAKKVLEERNFKISTVRTVSSPRMKDEDYNDLFRVIRIRQIEDGLLELLVCKPLLP